MTAPYVVGSDFDGTITYVTAAGVEVTGKVEGDFTIEVSKTGAGNQATTGITITEIDATNNAGQYQVNVDGGTGFMSAIAPYTLIIFDTADPTFRWVQEIRVTADGNPALTDGIAFTATSGDGRITGDATALVGAVVRVLDPSNNVIYQETTDASGLWGTVYLNDSTSYSIHVQATNYTSTTSSIVTAGGSATGPLADVDIVTASTTTSLTASNLWAYARRQSHDKVGSKATVQIKQAVNNALGMLGKVHKWDYLNVRGRANLRAPYDTGTVTVTDDSTTVTLAGGTWPTWVAGTEFLYDGVATKIESRDSTTQITLEFAYNGTTAAGASYIVFQYKYDVPDDCLQVGRMMGGTRFPAGAQHTDMSALETARDRLDYGNPDAYMWAFSGGDLAFWPYPSEDRMLNYMYWKKPADLVSDSDVAAWDVANISILYRAIDYHLATTIGCVVGGPEQCRDIFMEELKHHLPNVKSSASADIRIGMPGDASNGYFSTTIVT